MATAHGNSKNVLQRIAHEVMRQRGLLPDFSPAVVAEIDLITQAAAVSGAAIRDLRSLLWASIDNDDSRDLDQLSVAEPVGDGTVKILVAIADVDALEKKSPRSTATRGPTRLPFTQPRKSFRCCQRNCRPT